MKPFDTAWQILKYALQYRENPFYPVYEERCPKCGGPLYYQKGSETKVCGNFECGHVVYPQAPQEPVNPFAAVKT